MRMKRTSIVAGLATAMALASGGTALADGASDNISRVQGAFSPNAQSTTTYGAGTLFAQVQTIGQLNQDGWAAEAAERVFIDFDSNLKFDTAFAPKCSTAAKNAISPSGTSTQAAITACGKGTIVGAGTAHAVLPTGAPPAPVINAELTVTAFNGPTSSPGAACVAPAPGTGGPDGCNFVGGQPTILLHAYSEDLTYSSVVNGEIQNSPLPDTASASYGKRLAVTDAPDVAGPDAGSLTLFNSTVGKTSIQRKVIRRKGKRIVKRIPHYYVSARCSGDKDWDFAAEWMYDDGSVDNDTYAQKCGN